ncbi:hypothetical protein F5Y18DRAFT_441828, partial [Xylariaceae sp. FL1019]
MSSNLAQGYPVYLGLWTNWSRGQVLGATLTVTRQDATLFVAFTSTFIAFVATRAWRTVCFLLHRFYSSSESQNVTYHQLQAILRNASGAEDGLRLLIKLFQTNRRHGRHIRKILSVVGIAVGLIASFTILGGFSSRIAVSDDEVLIRSERCGTSYGIWGADNEQVFAVNAYQAGKINNAKEYAQQCYVNSTDEASCNSFVVGQIKNSLDTNSSCPFEDDSGICFSNEGNLRIDSGYINSHDHLGLNSPGARRVLWRNVLQCAPLSTDGYTSQDDNSFTNDTLFHYGNTSLPTGPTDYVYRAEGLSSQYKRAINNTYLTDINYHLDVFKSAVKNGVPYQIETYFELIDALTRTDADTYLMMLSGNGVVNVEPSDDPWYNVSKTATDTLVTGSTEIDHLSVYLPQAPASALACADQHQFCNTKGDCGPLASLRDAIAGAAPIFNTTYAQLDELNPTTEEAAQFLYFTSAFFDFDASISGVVSKLGPSALQSQDKMDAGVQGKLPSNQWQLDIVHFWDISMAIFQDIYSDSAFGSNDPALQSLRLNYTSSRFDKPCHNQKIKTTAFTSLSVFGILFTYIAGFLLILISHCLESASAWLHRKRAYGQFRHLEWTTNATMQLQRLAHEAIGEGEWCKATEDVPTTRENQLLGLLDISNPKHPVLRPDGKTEGPVQDDPTDGIAENADGSTDGSVTPPDHETASTAHDPAEESIGVADSEHTGTHDNMVASPTGELTANHNTQPS